MGSAGIFGFLGPYLTVNDTHSSKRHFLIAEATPPRVSSSLTAKQSNAPPRVSISMTFRRALADCLYTLSYAALGYSHSCPHARDTSARKSKEIGISIALGSR